MLQATGVVGGDVGRSLHIVPRPTGGHALARRVRVHAGSSSPNSERPRSKVCCRCSSRSVRRTPSPSWPGADLPLPRPDDRVMIVSIKRTWAWEGWAWEASETRDPGSPPRKIPSADRAGRAAEVSAQGVAAGVRSAGLLGSGAKWEAGVPLRIGRSGLGFGRSSALHWRCAVRHRLHPYCADIASIAG